MVFICFTCILKAQGSSDLSGDPAIEVPIDGGLSLLVAAGVGYGAKKLKGMKRKKDYRPR